MSGAIIDGVQITADVDVSCDVCIIGSGAGGAVLAAGLVEAGLTVVMLEAGGHHTRRDFNLQEGTAFPMLYQERGTRATADLAITILQGRSVGGSTTVNWTTCFRTPERILEHWQQVHGIEGLDVATLAPHFQAVEARLNVKTWDQIPPNPSNGRLAKGCQALGWDHALIRRNVKGCANSGYCGMGCPVDGKQAMHVTYLPDAVARGLTLYADTRADRIEVVDKRVVAVHATVLQRGYDGRVTGKKVTVRPKVCVSSGGAVNGPALFMRSGLGGLGPVGRRTFLHPVVAVIGRYAERIDGWYGAPQSVSSHHFIDRGADKYGFFLENAPLHPMLAAASSGMFGLEAQAFLKQMPYLSPLISLCVDGLVPGDEGGTVSLKSDGRIQLDYPISAQLAEGFRASHDALAKIHLAAGALGAASMHGSSVHVASKADLAALATAPYGAHEHTIFSAHQMGGCSMGNDASTSVVNAQHRHHQIPNLFVVDGSVFPTALGVNPSLTIYGLAHRARKFVGEAV
ncbi:MAG: GMC family oxidoreductase [Rhodobacterales bacterium]|nr:GMC family oxidoreductase [Rhodobacterales bacterium]